MEKINFRQGKILAAFEKLESLPVIVLAMLWSVIGFQLMPFRDWG